MMRFNGNETGGAGAVVDLQATQRDLDLALTLQLAIAWAGESSDAGRLAWWKTDLASKWAGEDLFQRLLPETWRWATLQAAREAAIRRDLSLRSKAHDRDSIVTLFTFGPRLDELLNERLAQLKTSRVAPRDALPGLRDVIRDPWHQSRFKEWLDQFPEPATEPSPLGRKIRSQPPEGLDALTKSLVGALKPLSETYPLPHYRCLPSEFAHE